MTKSIVAVCCLTLLATGCGGPANGPLSKEQGDEVTLAQVGELCRMYQFAKKKPPAKLTDLASVSTMAANGYEALKTGRIVLLYEATLPDVKEEPGEGHDDEVLAYVADVPQSGGKVLMLNRTIKTMSVDDFKAAKKAGKEVPLPAPGKKG
jgi:hypothetical protein